MEDYESKEERIALFWYRLILPFLHKKLGRAEKRAKVKEITSKEYRIPFSDKRKVKKITLLRKLKAYKKEGFGGLKPKKRFDKGKKRALGDDVVEKAIRLKEAMPTRSVRKIIMMLGNDNSLPSVKIAPATLYRIFTERGLKRDSKGSGQRSFIHFAREKINDLWQSDATFGIYLPDPAKGGRKKATHLFAFLDDCSRIVTHGEFYWHETLPRLEDCLKKAIIRRGIPTAIYCDNAQVYSSIQLDLICAELGIKIYHSKPYCPEGRGKIEKFFGFVQGDFIPEAKAAGIKTIEELNQYWFSWLEIAYHRKVHESLGMTPLNKWMSMTDCIKYANPLQLKEIFLWRENRTVDKYGEIRVSCNHYKVDDMLFRKVIEVRYDPFDLSEVYIFLDGNYVMKAYPVDLKKSVHKKVEKQLSEVKKEGESISYLEILRKKYDEFVKEKIKPISFVEILSKKEGYLGLKELTELIHQKVNIPITESKKSTIKSFHEQYGPFKKNKIEKLKAEKGEDKFMNFINFLNKIKKTKLGG